MSAAGFDTLKFARKLKAAGLPSEQAEAQAEVLGEAFLYNLDQLVSRDYLDARLAEVDARLSDMESRICSRVDARMDTRFAEVDARFAAVDARFDSVESRIKSIEEQLVEIKGQFRLVHWMLALILAANVIPSLGRFLG